MLPNTKYSIAFRGVQKVDNNATWLQIHYVMQIKKRYVEYRYMVYLSFQINCLQLSFYFTP